ncbi:hypothetical protein [Xanthomonas arboricola]|uniref:hypothetical protein n=1 Tax=Xanthomonas arboricola TaxID=56448 RepID=UPI0011B0B238|nr:hypothetical protein [Xanthomonas arboricola]
MQRLRNIARPIKWLTVGIQRWRLSSGVVTTNAQAYSLVLLASVLLLVGMGPTLQHYAAGFLTSNESNIYESAYQKAIFPFPSFGEWLKYSLDPAVALGGIIIWATSLTSARPRTALVRTFVAAFLGITMTDIMLFLIYLDADADTVVTSVVSNFFGGFLIAVIVVAMRGAAAYVSRFEETSSATKVLGLLMPLAIGFTCSGASFLFAKMFYEAPPIDFEAQITGDSRGYYRTETETETETSPGAKDKLEKAFRFFSEEKATNRPVRWAGIGKPFVATFHPNEPYKLKLYVVEGCTMNNPPAENLIYKAAEVASVTQLSVSLDAGASDYVLLPGSGIVVDPSPEEVSQFSISEKDKSTSFTLLRDVNKEVSFGQNGQRAMLISGFLVDKENDRPRKLARYMQISINNVDSAIEFIPAFKSRSSKPRDPCSITNTKINLGHKTTVKAKWPIAGIYLTLTPTVETDSWEGTQSDPIKIKGMSGWLTIDMDKPKVDEAETIASGSTDFFVAIGKFQKFKAANDDFPINGESSLQAFGGDMSIDADNAGKIDIRGSVKALYWNQKRVNKTRWEKIDTGWATIHISWILGLIYFALRWITAMFKQNYDLGRPI